MAWFNCLGTLLLSRWANILFQLVLCFFLANHVSAAVGEVIVCIQCHAALPGQLSEPVKLWRTSIHSENGINCNACHGGDPSDAAKAMSPAHGYRGIPLPDAVPKLCGGCHIDVTKYHINSPHGRALGDGGPTCVTCHGSHDIIRASLDLISKKNCTPCHSFEEALTIRRTMAKTDGMLDTIDKRIKVLKSQGEVTDPQEMRLYALRNRFHAMFHSLNIDLIRQESINIQAELESTNGAGIAGTGYFVGKVAVGVVLLAAVLFFMIRKYPE